jgi:hypothetical protein
MAKGLIFAAGLALAASTLSAQALPVGRADLGQGSLVTNVAQGCGPGGFRDWRGFCRYDGPRYGRPRVYGPPRVYGGPVVVGPRRPIRCWTAMTAYGPRRVCR